MFSPMDIAIVAGVALIIFGPKKFPELGSSLGKGIGNFKKAMSDANDEITNAVKTEPSKPANQETAPAAQPTAAAQATPAPAPAGGGTPESAPDKPPGS